MNISVPIDKSLREELFLATAQKIKINETVIEKDYWVCWVLEYLFNHSQWKDFLAFKGGTCLSKCFNLIKRFSEDIDIVLDWTILGYGSEEPFKPKSKTKQDMFAKEIRQRSGEYVNTVMIPVIQKDFESLISEPFRLSIDEKKETIFFEYPRSFNSSGLLDVIRLEVGALAAMSPNQTSYMQSYVAEQYPQIMGNEKFKVKVVSPSRTFWEKITILHKAAYFAEKEFPDRYSRHYYDIFELCQCGIKDQAIHNIKLMKEVVEFNKRFYPNSTYHFELAKPGTFKLIPSEQNLSNLEKDYRAMELMFFGNHPTFEELIEQIKKLQYEINHIY